MYFLRENRNYLFEIITILKNMKKRQREIIKRVLIIGICCFLLGIFIRNIIFYESKPLYLPASTILHDITYCTNNGVDSKMDIYFPIKFGGGPSPVLIYVHGGAWISGDKKTNVGTPDIPELLSRGYIIATVNYRLAPEHKFPAQIEDVKCAVRYLRSNAENYNIDPDNIGAFGDSAGGHLVSLLALTNESAGFDKGQYLNYSSSIKAVVDYFGPTNLTDSNFYNIYSVALEQIFGSHENMVNASPVKYVKKESPPFLIFQGDRDIIVFQDQSKELYNKLITENATATIIIVNGSTHGFVKVGENMVPSRENITTMVADFFDKYLKQEKEPEIETIKEIPYILDYTENKIYLQLMYKGKINEDELDSPVQELLKEGWKIVYKNLPQHKTTPQKVIVNN